MFHPDRAVPALPSPFKGWKQAEAAFSPDVIFPGPAAGRARNDLPCPSAKLPPLHRAPPLFPALSPVRRA
ncbi:hypothetical protein EJB05_24338 [Eragrostis curvula]|uniref:Uncharacterized protein n=1 Tax=Eragrostis curvula TaxID=38414 RepID=A0A5J9VCN0_9POAL|nr:hypothetical protein EJB05_24338 [Eragrostis curvula]